MSRSFVAAAERAVTNLVSGAVFAGFTLTDEDLGRHLDAAIALADDGGQIHFRRFTPRFR